MRLWSDDTMELWDQFSSELKITKRKVLGTSRPQTCQIQHDRVIKQGLCIPHHSVVWKWIMTEYSRLLWALARTSHSPLTGVLDTVASFPSRKNRVQSSNFCENRSVNLNVSSRFEQMSALSRWHTWKWYLTI